MVEITGYEVYNVPPRSMYLKLETDSGYSGWGQPIVTKSEITTEILRELIDNYVLGADPFSIREIWRRLYLSSFHRGDLNSMAAISGIDQALWDIKGKALDVPVYELLGGRVRDRVRLFQRVTDETTDLIESAEDAVADGFSAVKVHIPGPLRRIDTSHVIQSFTGTISDLRDAVGPQTDIIIDFHGRVSKSMTKRLAPKLEPYDPMYIEEPLPPEQSNSLDEIAQQTSIPLAVGERIYAPKEFQEVLVSDSVDIVQPHISFAGGISGVSRIVDAAELHDMGFTAHTPVGVVGFVASLHVAITAPNLIIQQVLNVNRDEITSQIADGDPFDHEEGWITIPEGPGFGISLDEEYLRERSGAGVDWETPLWRLDDGTITEW